MSMMDTPDHEDLTVADIAEAAATAIAASLAGLIIATVVFAWPLFLDLP